MRIIFCDSVFDNNKIEPDYEIEKTAALEAGFEFSLISFEELIAGNISVSLRYVKTSDVKEFAIYRGWMLTPNQYATLYKGLLAKNIQLINSVQEYTHCHYLPNSYSKIAHKTPTSNWITDFSDASLQQVIHNFRDKPLILKDFVKSEKHHWEEACYIPNAADFEKVKLVVDKFLELRGNSLNEGLVFREFEALQFLTEHSKSGMPLTKEFRVFFAFKNIIGVFNYWDEGIYDGTLPKLDEFIDIAATVESNFFTMDIAQKVNGEWIIIELGDGQVAGLPENANAHELYRKLKKTIIGE
ncbi:hypothetical protein C8N46_102253 [Kordia periserrulae]|uniref:ATP-grasp domain-containing protein n=1 Tax=Kordia periserrulae TaxID=701523 RepID=A0A2T6C3I6_9FLAO|nr:ATP-grasp domain-containing protein [Kordia periserrulae]PTX62853.1 hypothetical protein C8N46_102253 [Kordia periserrulae]